MSHKDSELRKGIFFILLYAICSASFGTAIKAGLHTTTFVPLTFVCYLTSLSFALVYIIVTGKLGDLFCRANLRLLIVRGVLGSLQVLLFMASLKSITLLQALLLRNTAPLWLPLLTRLILPHEKSQVKWLALLVGFVGTALIIHPHALTQNVGVLLALLAGLTIALASIFTRKLNNHQESFIKIMFYTFLMPVVALVLPFTWLTVPPSFTGVWLALVAGVVMFVMLRFFIEAYRHATPVVLAPFAYSSFLFAGMFDWIFFNDVPSWLTLGGAALIITGCLLANSQSGEV